MSEKKLSKVEGIKEDSLYLKGVISEELLNKNMIAVSDESYELLKFHGTYQGYNRDSATERKKAGLDKEFEFMVRLRIPAGRLDAKQYLAMDKIAENYANKTIRITTRETFQLHCVVKDDLKNAISAINKTLLSTLSACGDVVRNVMISPAPIDDVKHNQLFVDAQKIVELCTPKTTAYDEIWNDEPNSNRPKRSDENRQLEPLYGQHYLPRKFKIGLIIPEDNSIDVFSHDLGFVLIYEGEKLKGYNVLVGGGLGMTHNKKETYPRVASEIAFVSPEDLLNAVEAVVKLQRDHGDRTNRKHARLKYVVEENGLEWTRKTFEDYFNKTNPSRKAQDPIIVEKYEVSDHMGWHPHHLGKDDSKLYLGIPVSSGRIEDNEHIKIRTVLREIITDLDCKIVLTADQNIILCDIDPAQKEDVEKKLRAAGVKLKEDITEMERYMMACVALPTCGKALAEAERVKIPMQDGIQQLLDKYDLHNEKIAIRIAGCPNGCSRPYLGDIGIVGRMPGHYVLFIGGDFEGTRLNQKVFDKIPEKEIANSLEPMFVLFKNERNDGEGFGDFCYRYGIQNIAKKAEEKLADYKWAKYIG